MKRFPVPVTGQPIPKGWFARLVNFMNSLILSGDGSYVEVNYGDKGATITLTAAARNKIDRASGSPPGGGGTVFGTLGAPLLSSPTAVSEGVTYGPFAYPVWLIGSVGSLLTRASLQELYLSMGNTAVTLYRCNQAAGKEGTQITLLHVGVCQIIPASTRFELHTLQTPGTTDIDIDLNYYPATN